jgi:uncharacterized protein YecE (DUF72 family)
MSTVAENSARYLVGTSGWHYEHWKERFYPKGLGKPRWLAHYARFFGTVEVNASFYRLPSENAFRGWYGGSPPGFVFALKASRLITHYRRLVNVAEALEVFFARARLLGEKLGPILYQLPPDFARDDARLDAFLAQLPADLRHVVEFRHGSWFDDGVFDLLARRGVGFCVMDLVHLKSPQVATASTVYVRFHGATGVYSGPYGEAEMKRWAGVLKNLGAGRAEVFAYFNNDSQAHAVRDALSLQAALGEPAAD